MEDLILEMVELHDVQWSDILSVTATSYTLSVVLKGSVKKVLQKKTQRRVRKFGEICSDYDFVIEKMVNSHGMTKWQILSMVYNYLFVHCPEAREEYVDGGHPVFILTKDGYEYGHESAIVSGKKSKKAA